MNKGGVSSAGMAKPASSSDTLLMYENLKTTVKNTRNHGKVLEALIQQADSKLSEIVFSKVKELPPAHLMSSSQIRGLLQGLQGHPDLAVIRKSTEYEGLWNHWKEGEALCETITKMYANKEKKMLFCQEFTESEYQSSLDMWLKILDNGLSSTQADDVFTVLGTYPKNLKKGKSSSMLHLIVGKDPSQDDQVNQRPKQDFFPRKIKDVARPLFKDPKLSGPCKPGSLSQTITQITMMQTEDAIEAITGERVDQDDDDSASLPEILPTPQKQPLQITQLPGPQSMSSKHQDPKQNDSRAGQFKNGHSSHKLEDSSRKSVTSKLSGSVHTRPDSKTPVQDLASYEQRVKDFLNKTSFKPEDAWEAKSLQRDPKQPQHQSDDKLGQIYESLKGAKDLARVLSLDEGPEDFEELLESLCDEVMKLPGPGKEGFNQAAETILVKLKDITHPVDPLRPFLATIKVYYWERQVDEAFSLALDQPTDEVTEANEATESNCEVDLFQTKPNKPAAGVVVSETQKPASKSNTLSVAKLQNLVDKAPEAAAKLSKQYEVIKGLLKHYRQFRVKLETLIDNIKTLLKISSLDQLRLSELRGLRESLNDLCTVHLDPKISKFRDVELALKNIEKADNIVASLEALALVHFKQSHAIREHQMSNLPPKFQLHRFRDLAMKLDEPDYFEVKKQELSAMFLREASQVLKAVEVMEQITEAIKQKTLEDQAEALLAQKVPLMVSKHPKSEPKAYSADLWESFKMRRLQSMEKYLKTLGAVIDLSQIFKESQQMVAEHQEYQAQFEKKLSALIEPTYPVITDWSLQKLYTLSDKFTELRKSMLSVIKLHIPVMDEIACWEWLIDVRILTHAENKKPLPEQLEALMRHSPNILPSKLVAARPVSVLPNEQIKQKPLADIQGHVERVRNTLKDNLSTSKAFKADTWARLNSNDSKQPSSVERYVEMLNHLRQHPFAYPWLECQAVVEHQERQAFFRQLAKVQPGQSTDHVRPTFEQLLLVYHWAKKLDIAINLSNPLWEGLLERLYNCLALMQWTGSQKVMMFEVRDKYSEIQVQIGQIDRWFEQTTSNFREEGDSSAPSTSNVPMTALACETFQKILSDNMETVLGENRTNHLIVEPVNRQTFFKSKELKSKVYGSVGRVEAQDYLDIISDLEKCATNPPKFRDLYGVELVVKSTKPTPAYDWLDVFWVCLKRANKQMAGWLLAKKPPLEVLLMLLDLSVEDEVHRMLHDRITQDYTVRCDLKIEDMPQEIHQKLSKSWMLSEPFEEVHCEVEELEKALEEECYITWETLNPPPPPAPEPEPAMIEESPPEVLVQEDPQPIIEPEQPEVHLLNEELLGKKREEEKDLDVQIPEKRLLEEVVSPVRLLPPPMIKHQPKKKLKPLRVAQPKQEPAEVLPKALPPKVKEKPASKRLHEVVTHMPPITRRVQRALKEVFHPVVLPPKEEAAPVPPPPPKDLRISLSSSEERAPRERSLERIDIDYAKIEQKAQKAAKQLKKNAKMQASKPAPPPASPVVQVEPVLPERPPEPIQIAPVPVVGQKTELDLEEIAATVPPNSAGIAGTQGGQLMHTPKQVPSRPAPLVEEPLQIRDLTLKTLPSLRFQTPAPKEDPKQQSGASKPQEAQPLTPPKPKHSSRAETTAEKQNKVTSAEPSFLGSFANLDRPIDPAEEALNKQEESEEDNILEEFQAKQMGFYELYEEIDPHTFNLSWEEWLVMKHREQENREAGKSDEVHALASLSTESTRKPLVYETRNRKPIYHKADTSYTDKVLELSSDDVENIGKAIDQRVKLRTKPNSYGIWTMYSGAIEVASRLPVKKFENIRLGAWMYYKELQAFAAIPTPCITFDKSIPALQFQKDLLDELPAFKLQQRNWASGMVVFEDVATKSDLIRATSFVHFADYSGCHNTKLYILRPQLLERTGLGIMVERYPEIKAQDTQFLVWFLTQDALPTNCQDPKVGAEGIYFDPPEVEIQKPRIVVEKQQAPVIYRMDDLANSRPTHIRSNHYPPSRTHGGISRQPKIGTDGDVSRSNGNKFGSFAAIPTNHMRPAAFAAPEHLGKRTALEPLEQHPDPQQPPPLPYSGSMKVSFINFNQRSAPNTSMAEPKPVLPQELN